VNKPVRKRRRKSGAGSIGLDVEEKDEDVTRSGSSEIGADEEEQAGDKPPTSKARGGGGEDHAQGGLGACGAGEA
jgi:hypothetical protein